MIRTEKIETNDKGVETHPAFGLVSITHTTCGGESGAQRMFQSPFMHRSVVTLRVRRASQYAPMVNGMEKHAVAGQELIEVDLTPLQFAEMISRPNHGDGVPCTIQTFAGETMPKLPEPEKTKTDEQTQEIKEQVAAVGYDLDKAIATMAEMRAAKQRPTLSELDAMIKEFQAVRQDLVLNLPFLQEQFEKSMARTVASAKLEISAYLHSSAVAGGITMDRGPLLLEESPQMSEDELASVLPPIDVIRQGGVQ